MSMDNTTTKEQSSKDLLVSNQAMFKKHGENLFPTGLASDFATKTTRQSVFLDLFPSYDGDSVPTGNSTFLPGENNQENIGITKLTLQEIGINCSRAGNITMDDMQRFAERLASGFDNFILNNKNKGLVQNSQNTTSTIESLSETLVNEINALQNDGCSRIVVLLNPVAYGHIYNNEATVKLPSTKPRALFNGADIVFVPEMQHDNLALVIGKDKLSFAFPKYFRVTTTVNQTTMHNFFSIVGSIGINNSEDGMKLINLKTE